jgi:hypothetical protein
MLLTAACNLRDPDKEISTRNGFDFDGRKEHGKPRRAFGAANSPEQKQ